MRDNETWVTHIRLYYGTYGLRMTGIQWAHSIIAHLEYSYFVKFTQADVFF